MEKKLKKKNWKKPQFKILSAISTLGGFHENDDGGLPTGS
jgi:hypothetical protein